MALLWIAPIHPKYASAASLTPQEQAGALLERLTPEERVGQLFLVTYEGTDVGSDSQIATLMDAYFIGGIVLLAENDNFTYDPENPADTINNVITMNRELQTNRWEASRGSRDRSQHKRGIHA